MNDFMLGLLVGGIVTWPPVIFFAWRYAHPKVSRHYGLAQRDETAEDIRTKLKDGWS